MTPSILILQLLSWHIPRIYLSTIGSLSNPFSPIYLAKLATSLFPLFRLAKVLPVPHISVMTGRICLIAKSKSTFSTRTSNTENHASVNYAIKVSSGYFVTISLLMLSSLATYETAIFNIFCRFFISINYNTLLSSKSVTFFQIGDMKELAHSICMLSSQ